MRFWKREWAKHGIIQKMNPEEYFSSTVLLLDWMTPEWISCSPVHADADDIRIGMGESCREMMNSRGNGTDNCYVPEHGMLVTEPFATIYYGSQQSMEGLGQPSIRTPTMQACFEMRESLQDAELAATLQFHYNAAKHLHDNQLSQ
ncbi:hypothetical protein Tsubulata_015053 [Turnera subulata]|uniref:Uncharacterized protein n=1 Tax=Turnera subulata TaxID=218843 RepID=A0A9Q0G2J4_9ROSI|nr:hypothetical protein Tsubulata_015053 [Turnera subulata]